MKKKLIALILAVLMIMSLAACSGSGDDAASGDSGAANADPGSSDAEYGVALEIKDFNGTVGGNVSGEEKQKLTVPQLLELFSKVSGSDEANDKLLLS